MGEEWPAEEWLLDADAAADDDLAALWGEEPAAVSGASDPADAYAATAEGPAAVGLDDVSFTPPATLAAPAPAETLAGGADFWGDPEPPTVPAMPEPPRGSDEPPGGIFASTAPTTPLVPPPAAPTRPAPVTAPSQPAPTQTAAVDSIPSAPVGSNSDPFGEDTTAAPMPPATAAGSSSAGSSFPGNDDPFAGAVTQASMSAASAAPSAVTTADRSVAPPWGPEPNPEPAAAASDPDLLAAIDDALAVGEVLQAHTELSRLWWDDAAARSAIRGRLDGTARQIYFDAASHFMTPRTVAAGETLEDVAADLSVPAMYLARVNRVAPSAVRAGDELKVIRGPFGAALDLSGAGAGTLTMHAHGYYVRSFAARTAGVTAGDYAVGGKSRTVRGVQILLIDSATGATLRLVGGPLPPGLAAVSLRAADADQVFDLLDKGAVLSVRP